MTQRQFLDKHNVTHFQFFFQDFVFQFKIFLRLIYYNLSMCKILIFILVFFQTLSFAYAAPAKKQRGDVSKRKGPVISTTTVHLTTNKPDYCLFGGQTGKPFFGEASYKMTIWRNKIIYLGESGGRQDYTAQLDTLKAMNIARGSKIVVAFGTLNREIQPIFDEYLAEAITQEEFFSYLSDREDTNFDIFDYKPLFDFIVEKKIRAIAIGLSPMLKDTIYEYGLDGLSRYEKNLIPLDIAVPQNERYNKFMEKKYSVEFSTKSDTSTLNKYILATAAINDSMAKNLSDFLTENPEYAALVIVNNDSLPYASGITLAGKKYLKDYAYTTIYIKHATVCSKELPDADKDLAGYIWFMDNTPKRENTSEIPAKNDLPVVKTSN